VSGPAAHYARFVRWRRCVEAARARVWREERRAGRVSLLAVGWLLVAAGDLVTGRMGPLRIFTLVALAFLIFDLVRAAHRRVRAARRRLARREAERWEGTP
jgi:hypothetical protein